MRNKSCLAILLVALFGAQAKASSVNWETVKNIAPGSWITVVTKTGTVCSFERATDDTLFCRIHTNDADAGLLNEELSFNRKNVVEVCARMNCAIDTTDYSKGSLVLLGAAAGGGGWDSSRNPTSFSGIKLGFLGVSLDFQYDRLHGHNGFSTEGSGVIPLFRVPRFRPGKDRLWMKVFAEPGLGYRAGSGPFGQYASAKALALLGDKWVNDGFSPYIEFQRRFPFNGPLDGDNRIAFGFMWALCGQCGDE